VLDVAEGGVEQHLVRLLRILGDGIDIDFLAASRRDDHGSQRRAHRGRP
jgi:hypothetical protein